MQLSPENCFQRFLTFDPSVFLKPLLCLLVFKKKTKNKSLSDSWSVFVTRCSHTGQSGSCSSCCQILLREVVTSCLVSQCVFLKSARFELFGLYFYTLLSAISLS